MKNKGETQVSKAKKTDMKNVGLIDQPKNMPKSSKKPLYDYEQSKPVQMELFEALMPVEKQFSNTIDIFPK
jgi:hypothetical protein